MEQNWFATLALLLWAIVGFWLYTTKSFVRATIWTVLGAEMLLPEGGRIKIAEGIPQLDKEAIPAIVVLGACLAVARQRPQIFGRGWPAVLILIVLGGPIVTSLLNSDWIITAGRVLPGVSFYEGASMAFSQLMLFTPFLVGRQFFRNASDIEDILYALVVAALAYSALILFEIRMSPQLHFWIYGYSPSSFFTEARYGGFRPIVFMGNGLIVSYFVATSLVAAAVFWRLKHPVKRLPPGPVAAYLGVILVLCKTAGALVYGAAFSPLARWAAPRLQLRVAIAIAVIGLSYPLLRAMDWVPTTTLLGVAATFDQERADSLGTRFTSEDALLERASERPWFGWGRFGRSRIYDESGRDSVISDGRWIIIFGQWGVVGFLGDFGLLALPIFYTASAFKRTDDRRDRILLAGLSLIVAMTIVDQIPNASVTSWTWLFAGALMGRAEAIRSGQKVRVAPKSSLLFASPGPLEPRSSRREIV